MTTSPLLFPAALLPPEGDDRLPEIPARSDLEGWLAILPGGGPGYLLGRGSCDRNADAPDPDADALLPLSAPDPDTGDTLGIDFALLDRAMHRAWQSVSPDPDRAPAAQLDALFHNLSRQLPALREWSMVWSWDSRGGDEIEICLRALCRGGSAPVLYHEALPEISGNSARDVLAAGLLSLLAVSAPLASATPDTDPTEEIESEGEFSGLLREIGKAPNKKQDPVRINDALLKNMEGAEVSIIVDRGAQRAYLLVDGAIAVDTPISSGTRGHTTPLGSFPILEKIRTGKRSTIYHCALPRWMRLTWRGIGMHVGDLPGYPASHGCIRLPEAGATALFDHTPKGTIVSVVATWDRPAPPADGLLAEN